MSYVAFSKTSHSIIEKNETQRDFSFFMSQKVNVRASNYLLPLSLIYFLGIIINTIYYVTREMKKKEQRFAMNYSRHHCLHFTFQR